MVETGAWRARYCPIVVWILMINRAPGTKVKVSAMRGAKTVNGELTLAEAPF